MSKDILVGLGTLSLKSTMPALLDTPQRALKRRVFTEDEWRFLNSRPSEELQQRIRYGDKIIGLLARPDMLNMTPQRAAAIASNLRYQQDAITEIIRSRQDGSR